MGSILIASHCDANAAIERCDAGHADEDSLLSHQRLYDRFGALGAPDIDRNEVGDRWQCGKAQFSGQCRIVPASLGDGGNDGRLCNPGPPKPSKPPLATAGSPRNDCECGRKV